MLRPLLKRRLGFLVATSILFASCSILGLPSRQDSKIEITGQSMQPTIPMGSILFLDEDAYAADSPQRGDIVAFIHPRNSDVILIKRIIGLPGEHVEISDQGVFINGRKLGEPYLHTNANYRGNWTIGQQEYFVLSDARDSGSDSHLWGGLSVENIIGKATTVCQDDSLEKCSMLNEITY